MRAEEIEVYETRDQIKAFALMCVSSAYSVLNRAEDGGLLRSLSAEEYAEQVELICDCWLASEQFEKTYGCDIDTCRLFSATVEHALTGKGQDHLSRAEERYHKTMWIDRLPELEASEKAMARAS